MRGCQRSNITSWLSDRECGRTSLRRPFAEVPERLQIPVDSIIDEQEQLKGAVILGWTHSGDCLITYTSCPVLAADGREGHHLQLWRFHPFRRAVRLCNIPLFRAETGSGPAFPGATAASLLVTIWTGPDDSSLVVHGEAAEDAMPVPEAVCHVTVILGLSPTTSVQALHFDYCPLHPLSRFQPSVQLAPPGTLVLATVTGVECIQFAAEPVKWAFMRPELSPHVHGLTLITATIHRLILANSLVYSGRSTWLKAVELGMDFGGREEAFWIEPFLQKWMLSNLPGHQLTDYDLQFVALLPPAAPSGTAAAASEYDFIGSDDDEASRDSSNCRVLGSSMVLIAAAARKVSAAGLMPAVAAFRTVCLLVDIDLATGVGEVLSAADATPRQDYERGRIQPRQQAQRDVRAIAAAHAMGWRRRFAAPQDVRRMPTVLSNASVLDTGRSVDRLRHPWLPMCLKGYAVAAQTP